MITPSNPAGALAATSGDWKVARMFSPTASACFNTSRPTFPLAPVIGGVLIWILCFSIVSGWVFDPFANPSFLTKFRHSALNVSANSPQIAKPRLMWFSRFRLENISIFYKSVKMHKLLFFIDGLPKLIVNVGEQKCRSLDHGTHPGVNRGYLHI